MGLCHLTLRSNVEAGRSQAVLGCPTYARRKQPAVLPGDVLHSEIQSLFSPKPLEASRRALRENVFVDQLRWVAIRQVLEVSTRNVRRLELPCLMSDVEQVCS